MCVRFVWLNQITSCSRSAQQNNKHRDVDIARNQEDTPECTIKQPAKLIKEKIKAMGTLENIDV